MSRVSPTLHNLTRQLLAAELRARGQQQGDAELLAAAVDRLATGLRHSVGQSGTHALVRRALTLAREEHPWLESVQPLADGRLPELAELAPEGADLTETAHLVIGLMLELIRTFIGEELTLRVVREVWPDSAPLAFQPDSGKESRS